MKLTKEHVVKEFGSKGAQQIYGKLAETGLWESEKNIIDKYFVKKNAKLLDLGCGTGRTTMPLSKIGFKVIGVDITPEMIENAKAIAKRKKLDIDYKVGDATDLDFNSNSFDYVFFSNQGWTQIPDSREKLKALKEVHRVLKENGIYIFSSHRRVWFSEFFFTWVKLWLRFYILKPLGFNIPEIDFGDRFFERESYSVNNLDANAKYDTQQYIHIFKEKEIRKMAEKVGFEILYVGNGLSESSGTKPMFFVCKKI